MRSPSPETVGVTEDCSRCPGQTSPRGRAHPAAARALPGAPTLLSACVMWLRNTTGPGVHVTFSSSHPEVPMYRLAKTLVLSSLLALALTVSSLPLAPGQDKKKDDKKKDDKTGEVTFDLYKDKQG